MIPQFSDIKVFVTVSQTKNLSRASERLGIGQPAVTLSIQRLEEAIGEKLFVRLKTGVELTKIGAQFLPKAHEFLNVWSSLLTFAQSSTTSIQGKFKIGCHPSVAMYSLDKFLPQLMQEGSQLEIQIVHALSREILEQVVNFEIDFGLVINPKRHPDLVLKKLCVDTVNFWKSEKTQSNQTLIYDPNLLQSQSLLKKLRLQQKSFFSKFLEVTNLEVLATLVKSGVGIGILPERVAQLYGLKLYQTGMPTFNDELFLIYRSDLQKTVASKFIIDAITQSKI